MKALRLGIAVFVLFTAGCGGEPTAEETPGPDGFDVPDGVTLTAEGTTRELGKSSSVVYQIADQTRSAITLRVDEIDEGDIDDFEFFNLDDETQEATPYYVQATLRNEGPAGLGGAPVPLYAHDSANEITPPADIVGNFTPCENRVLPESLLPTEAADVCLVFLVPDGRTLTSIDLLTTDMDEAISWKP